MDRGDSPGERLAEVDTGQSSLSTLTTPIVVEHHQPTEKCGDPSTDLKKIRLPKEPNLDDSEQINHEKAEQSSSEKSFLDNTGQFKGGTKRLSTETHFSVPASPEKINYEKAEQSSSEKSFLDNSGQFKGGTTQLSTETHFFVPASPKKIRLSKERILNDSKRIKHGKAEQSSSGKSFLDNSEMVRRAEPNRGEACGRSRLDSLNDFAGCTQQISRKSRVSADATASKKIRLSKDGKSFPGHSKTARPTGHKSKNSFPRPRLLDDQRELGQNTSFPKETRFSVETNALSEPRQSTSFPKEARFSVETNALGTSSCTGDREGNDPPESLFTVLDGDGNIYHAFMEVCNEVFSGTPRQTIKSRMRTLGLNLVRCPANVQEKVRKARPQLAGFKVISLIAKRDVAILEAYHQSRAPNERSKFIELCSPNRLESSTNFEKNRPSSALFKVKRDFSPDVRGGKLSAIPSVNATSQNVLLKGNRSSVETRTSQTQASPECPRSVSDDECSQCAEEEECSSSDDDDDSGDSHVEGNLHEDEYDDEVTLIVKKRKLDSTQFESVIKEMKPMHIFYTTEYNHKRHSPRMTASTWTKHVERLVTFFNYTSEVINRTPALALVDDMELVESFLRYLQNVRRIQHTTAARYVHSLLITTKYIHVDNRRKDYEEVESVHQLRALRQQLEKAQVVQKSMPSVRLFWPQYQELVRSLFRNYEEASGAMKARLHMNFTMLLLFAVNPGRSKELRDLRLLTDVEENTKHELVKRIPHGDNVIIFSKNGSVSLIEKGYKTFSKYGVNVVEFDSEFQFLTYHLREYSRTSRPKLLPREALHDYYFVNNSGMPFNSSGSFSKYLSRLFKKHLGFPCAINEMRHSLVEHFRSSPESSDTRLAESLARVCKHSLRAQIDVYDRRTEPERRSQALRYLNRSAENFILDEAPGTSADLSTDEEEKDDLPSPGEICALVAADASANDPRVLLAKVLKYTADGKNARLAWFKELDSRPNHFAFQVGTDVWQEKSSALIYPVDVTYHRSDGIYELRTPKERIHSLVRNGNQK